MPIVKEKHTSLEQLIQNRLSQKRIGASFEFDEYLLADGISLPKSFQKIDHPEFTETKLQLSLVLAACQQIGQEVLSHYQRENGPEIHNTHHGHGLRSASIVINEFGVIDPMVVATSYLHDLYQVIINTLPETLAPDQRRHAAREHVRQLINQYFQLEFDNYPEQSFQLQLLANLEDLFVLEQDYKNLADRLVKKERLLEPILANQSVSPAEFLGIRQRLINKYMLNHTTEGKFMNLEEVFRYSLDKLQQKNTLGENTLSPNSAGVAVILALIAEAVDNHRYPAQQTSVESNLRRALISHLFLTVMARSFDLPTAVRDLSEQVNQVFFGQTWTSFKQALTEIGQQHSRNWFTVQERMSSIQLHKSLADFFADNDWPASYVSPAEFEARKVNSQLLPNDEYLADWEYTISTDVKTPASIFAKWVVHQAQGKINSDLSLEANEPLNTDYWQRYLSGTPDLIRANVVLGRKLALELVESDFFDLIADQLAYPQESKNPYPQTTNYFSPSRQEESAKQAAESWRVEPLLDDELIFFEYHLCLQLTNPKQSAKTIIPFEVHFEPVDQWYRDNLGSQTHQLYKDKDLIPNQPLLLADHHRVYMVGLYQMIQRELHNVYYNGLKNQSEDI